MSTLQFKSDVKGACAVIGSLNYAAITPLFWQQTQALIANASSSITFDLSDTSNSDSAGVALLIAWVRLARQQKKTLHFLHLPDQMRAIIRVSGLEKLLPIS